MLLTDERDFDASVLIVRFPADENNPISEIDVPVPIIDDDVDEAESQFFYAELEVVANATNLDLVDIENRNFDVALCNIRDDDGK